ncbi:acyltransferase family protein [Comamonas jiangduensis]|uniref:Acyltransferase family protein n=1 Tax=Comamonas jiangduensis TaxID=1194168 RepID=A0ABV4I8P3_9BURK
MTSRNTALDQIKAVACLLIVCHHLAFYGPMSDALHPAFGGLLAWLDEYARMAVQVFLVLGGYFAAAALAPQGVGRHPHFWPVLSKRFVRLSLPYSAALVVAIVVNETVRGLGFEHDSVSATPTWASVIAHLLLLHSVADFESISAGVWYVAIDFQLYALCLLWLWLCKQGSRWAGWGQAGITAATAASLWVWNLNPDLDIWAVYFMGAYGLGMMAWWATHSEQRAQRMLWVALIAALTLAALGMEWRDRIALAGASALLLAIGGNVHWREAVRTWQLPPLVWVGQRSYSIFLIHFPMCLLVSAAVHTHWPDSMVANSLGMVAAVLLSISAGAVLYAWTERSTATWQRLRHWHVGVLSTGLMATLLQWM